MSEQDAQRSDDATWSCPGCRATLERVAAPEGTFSGCAVCGGLWLDNPAASAVMAGRLTPPSRAFIARVTSSARAPAPPAPAGAATRAAGGYREPAPAGPRACPVCHGDLVERRLPYPAIIVDLCAPHGTYFDLWELSAIVASVDERMWAAYHEAHAHAARAAWQSQWATGDAGLDEVVAGFGDVLRRL